MTSAQRTALRFVCLMAGETADPRFSHHRRTHRLVLTVNSGYE
jgi:hypothetical protein